MSNVTPDLPFPGGDDDPAAPTTEVNGEEVLDPDIDDDAVDSAEADVIAADGDPESR